MKKYYRLLIATYNQWMKNEPFQQSAVIAYYTLFSLPSLLVIIISVSGYFFGKSTVKAKIIGQLGEVIGAETAGTVERIIGNVSIQEGSTTAIIISVGVLLFGATGAFFQLKKAMNKIWSVREKKVNVVMMILDRLISLGMVLVIGLLMVSSLILTTLITGLGRYISEFAPSLTAFILNLFNLLFSYLFIGFLFALVFKLLPDIKIRWKTVMVGASVTTILFLIAEYALSFYFGYSNPASVFGGASSVILIMVWIYYSCLILFFGAEFTVQYAVLKNDTVKPNRFSEPAILQELKELKEKKIHLKERRELIRELASEEADEEI